MTVPGPVLESDFPLGPTCARTCGFEFPHCCWHLGSYLSLELDSVLNMVFSHISRCLELEKEVSLVHHVAKILSFIPYNNLFFSSFFKKIFIGV